MENPLKFFEDGISKLRDEVSAEIAKAEKRAELKAAISAVTAVMAFKDPVVTAVQQGVAAGAQLVADKASAQVADWKKKLDAI